MNKISSEHLWEKINLGKIGNMIAGPCAVESTMQLEKVSAFLAEKQVKILRAGAYKPRTKPKAFQGLGKDGVKIIHDICEKYGLISVTEIMDIRDLDYMEQAVDIIQVGSRNMFNYSMLKELGKIDKPILLKRGFMATIEEFIYASDYIQNEGNTKIIMCERGVRSFERETRNTLDLSCVALVKQKTNYPVVVDLSHSLGRKDIMATMAKASLVAGADMLMVEVHPEPEKALSDAKQQLSLNEFEKLLLSI